MRHKVHNLMGSVYSKREMSKSKKYGRNLPSYSGVCRIQQKGSAEKTETLIEGA